MGPPTLIGIGGGSGAGKTTVIQLLQQRLGRLCVLDLDSYYVDRSGLSHEVRQHLNYDEPTAFDIDLLLEHVDQLRNGRQIAKPIYSFMSHTRNGARIVVPAPTIVIEGILALWWPELRTLLDIRIYVDAPSDIRLLRRISRDIEKRGRGLQELLTQYLESVRPMHERYVEPTRKHADLIVGNGEQIEDCVESIIIAVQTLMRPRGDDVLLTKLDS